MDEALGIEVFLTDDHLCLQDLHEIPQFQAMPVHIKTACDIWKHPLEMKSNDVAV